MSQKWADQPYSLISTPKYLGTYNRLDDAEVVNLASTMANVHNCILRGLNSIYLQAPHVPADDYANFIGYCLCWYDMVEEHHHSEDTRFFLAIDAAAGGNGQSGMAVNSQQHESFHEPLTKFHEYLKEVQGTSKLSGTHLQALINAFGPTLHSHLQEEIDTLLALRGLISPEGIRALVENEKKAAMSSSALNVVLFMVMNADATYEGGLWKDFPDGAPPRAMWLLKNVIGRIKCGGYWKYASCSRDGTPRPLYALQQGKKQ